MALLSGECSLPSMCETLVRFLGGRGGVFLVPAVFNSSADSRLTPEHLYGVFWTSKCLVTHLPCLPDTSPALRAPACSNSVPETECSFKLMASGWHSGCKGATSSPCPCVSILPSAKCQERAYKI